MADRLRADEVILRIVKELYDNAAQDWTVQQKGSLLAAIKLQLQKREKET